MWRGDGQRKRLQWPQRIRQWGIIIIQPQMTKRRYEHVAALHNSVERTRLKLLETMLNSARGTVTGLGADLEVIGSL